ncbi:trypsin-like serine protease [Whalleya microplaca]|nr:trypsin-like serine protease [Whalleya microplaca]
MAPTDYTDLIGTWSIDLEKPIPAAESSFVLEQTSESVFDPDHRAEVDKNDYRDDGKYRAIVKLQMKYQGQDSEDTCWAMGTGWLIKPDLLVTAGHNVYNWSGSDGILGRAVHIKCFIGYHGRDSIGTDIVQERKGERVVTTAEWLLGKENRHADVALIKVDEPFTGKLRVFSYNDTPTSGDEQLGVVGYPGDKYINDSYGRQEKGAYMYEQYNDIQYNLRDYGNHPPMLKYRISTFGGQSGSPVIRSNAKQVVIATHVYGGGDKNLGSLIGTHGNDYEILTRAVDQMYPVVAQHMGIDLLDPRGTHEGHFIPYEPETFWDVIKSVGEVVSTTGKAVWPTVPLLLGPIQASVAAVAGGVLGTVANICAETDKGGANTPSIRTEQAVLGTIERATIAEALLEAVLKVEENSIVETLLQKMEKTYEDLAPSIQHIVPKLSKELKGLAYRIAVNGHVRNGGEQLINHPAHHLQGINAADTTSTSDDFLGNMLKSTKPLQGDVHFFNVLDDFIKTGLKRSKPLLSKDAKYGLERVDKALAEAISVEEADVEGETQATELVTKRALIGEAALQAIVTLRDDELVQLTIPNGDGDIQETFFDYVTTVGQQVGPIAKEASPITIEKVVAEVDHAMTKYKPQAITNPKPASSSESPSAVALMSPKKRVVLDLINNHTSDGTLKVSALGPPAVIDSLARQARQSGPGGSQPRLQRVDSNEDLPVFQEL